MATALFVLLWWVALFGWWVVLVGTNSGIELVAAGCAALIAALLATGLRQRGMLRYRFGDPVLARTLKVPWKVVQELVIVVWALALHVAGLRRVSSAYRAFPFPTGGRDAVSAGRRAVATEADALSPNTLPLDMDCDTGLVLRHELDPRRTSNDLP
jgi:hypothetical protein